MKRKLSKAEQALLKRATGIADLIRERDVSDPMTVRHTDYVLLSLAAELFYGLADKGWQRTKRLGR